MSWFSKLSISEHRKAPRMKAPLLVAYYWDGAAPMAREIKNISSTGFYLVTKERWHPGTIITMTLQRTSATQETPAAAEHYVSVMSKVVRLDEEGVAFSFIPLESQVEGMRSLPAGKKTIGKFVELLKSDQGHAIIGYIDAILKTKLPRQDLSSAIPGENGMKRLKSEEGQALVISALCMTCLLGFVALATDVGIMLNEKRLVQTAADSAAIAGALELNYYPAGIVSAAKAASSQNGITDGVGGATVIVNPPPLNGPHTGVTGYVEVVVSQVQPTLFMNLFGLGSMTVKGRAVALNGGSSYGCVYIMAPTGSATLDLQGSFDVTAPNCGIIVNSSDPGALSFTGASGDLTAGSVGVVGGCTGHCGDSTPAPVTGIVAQSDPLGAMTPPVPTGCTAAPGNKLTGTLTNPGGSVGGVVCYSGNVTLTDVTLGSGTYVFTGNVTLDGNISTPIPTSGSPTLGSTIDINSGTLKINTGTTLALYAPHGGTYNGIALMEPSTNSNQITIQKGNASGLINGIIYAPSAELFLQDSGGDKDGGLTLVTDLIVGKLFDKTATLSIQSYSQSTGTSPLTKVTLVE